MNQGIRMRRGGQWPCVRSALVGGLDGHIISPGVERNLDFSTPNPNRERGEMRSMTLESMRLFPPDECSKHAYNAQTTSMSYRFCMSMVT